jgi:alpha-tubulin suppressor-like RCC1 family protein
MTCVTIQQFNAVSCGENFTAVVATKTNKTTQDVFTVGDNKWGQLGYTANNDSNPVPYELVLPTGVGSESAVSCGKIHTAVVATRGFTAYAYLMGFNGSGQLGYTANFGSNPDPYELVLSTGVGSVSAVSCGDSHTAVVATRGLTAYAYLMGNNRYGRLGYTATGIFDANPDPYELVLPTGVGSVSAVSCGNLHTAVVATRGLTAYAYLMGNNNVGQLGYTASSSNPDPYELVLPTGVGSVSAVSCGDSHTAVVATRGLTAYAYLMGNNNVGQLGYTASFTNPDPYELVLPAGVGSVSAVSCGDSHTAVVATRGLTAYAYLMGNNNVGQLGYTASGFNPDPYELVLPTGVGSVSAVSCGNSHTAVLTVSGEVYIFGSNTKGQLGSSSASVAGPLNFRSAFHADFILSVYENRILIDTNDVDIMGYSVLKNGRVLRTRSAGLMENLIEDLRVLVDPGVYHVEVLDTSDGCAIESNKVTILEVTTPEVILESAPELPIPEPELPIPEPTPGPDFEVQRRYRMVLLATVMIVSIIFFLFFAGSRLIVSLIFKT